MSERIDLDRCRAAMKNLYVRGKPRTGLVEAAIAAIQNYPDTAFQKVFYGIKNYAGFGDQREDCAYGYGPRHGHIVFNIGRTQQARDKAVRLGADEIYLLEAVRDFGIQMIKDEYGNRDGRAVNLVEAITEFDNLQKKAGELGSMIGTVQVESHEVKEDSNEKLASS